MPKITAEQLRYAAAKLECMSDDELDQLFRQQSPSPTKAETYAFLERLICGSSKT